ncbi:class I SAM-dependent methyltransferase family protein [Candidatus Woesearchaeota archaeon]|nr:class I SAM-dependent methyltransferase family protein [Candidatus Woesearchaeota archaeon]
MLTAKDLKLIPKSFDVIGDILVFADFPKELIKKEKKIGSYLLKKLKNVKVVTRKTRHFSGVYRLQKLKIMAGEERKETLHKENNCMFKLNVETCYFSPRLGNERLRIAKQVKKNEKILVMFSGVSVYSIILSKKSNAREIYDIEINPIANKYAEENLVLNKVRNVKLIRGDVRKIVPKLKKKFDRIVMPLPKGGEDFLELALNKIKKNGVIHFYDFLREEEIPETGIEKIKKMKRKFKILNVVKCGQIAPEKYRVCFDIKILN